MVWFVAGSTQDRGSSVVFSKVENDQVRVETQIDYGRLRLEPGATEELETLAVGYFDDARLGLESWADAVAKVYDIHLRPQPVGYCTWYSQPYGGASDEVHLPELATFAAKQLAPFGFSVVQIDDHWQAGISTNGPKRNFTTHAAQGPFPSGMKAMADRIKANGLVPGIWFMPFAGTYYDPFFQAHPDWFVKRANGQPYETAWGGTCLDMTEPGAREYLAGNVRRIAHEWGYQYFKMDGLWTGTATKQIYVNTGYRDEGIGDAVFHNPKKTNLEAYRSGLKLVRQTAGAKVFFLGCCAPQNMRSYGGAFGLVDAMRIGPDNGSGWGGLLRGPTFGSRHYFLHGRVWYNDPDPVYVRASMPLAHAQVICSWVTLSGQLNLSSEWLPGLPPERLDILKRAMPSHGLLPRPADLFEEPIPRVWLLTDDRRSPRRDVIGLFNWSEAPLEFDDSLARIGLAGDREYVAFDYWQNRFVPPFAGRLKSTLPGQSCQVLAVRPRLNRPLVISTSRHITQGIVDLVEENWDEAGDVLSGRSKVVGGDSYELRTVALAKDKGWLVKAVEVSDDDKSAGVKIRFKERNGLVRATIESPVSRDVSWSLHFGTTDRAAAKTAAVTGLQAEALEPTAVTLQWDGEDGVVYEVRRNQSEAVATTAANLRQDGLQPGTTYHFAVTAVGWSGQRSVPRELTVATPPIPKLPPPPPQPQVRLTSLRPLKATTGWGRVGTGKSVAGGPLRIGEQTYPDGIGVHAVSELVYDCQPEYQRFVAVAGLDEEIRSNDRSSVVFKVVAETPSGAKTLAASPILKFGQIEFWHFDVPLPADCRRLHLWVDDAGDGINSDHADWAAAGFIVGDK